MTADTWETRMAANARRHAARQAFAACTQCGRLATARLWVNGREVTACGDCQAAVLEVVEVQWIADHSHDTDTPIG